MKCKTCEFESAQDFSYCPNCGKPAQPGTVEASVSIEPVNTAAQTVLSALKDTLFLVLCILMSVTCGVALVSTGPDVLSILFTIFLWLVYGQSRNGIADAAHLRRVSGTVYAHYVIVNVCAILLVVLGGIIGLCFSALVSDTAFVNEILAELDLGTDNVTLAAQLLASASGIIFFIIFALIGAIMIVINLFSIRYIHRFAKSVYQSVESGKLELKHIKATYRWLIVFAVCSGLGLLGNLGSGDFMLIVSGAASCAMPIVAAILVKKYFMTEK